MTSDGILRGVLLDEFRVLMSFLTEEIDARPLVRYPLVHRDDRIEQDGEVRA